jgi:transcriptional regulator with XRE-family HTH domain
MFTTVHNLDYLQFYECLMDQKARDRLIQKLTEAQAGRSQRKFADDLEVALGTVQNWLRGDSFPMVDKFEKIAASLGISQQALFSYIVTGSEEIINAPPTVPSVAEDVRAYAGSLSVNEKIRLLGLIGSDIANQAALEAQRDYDS